VSAVALKDNDMYFAPDGRTKFNADYQYEKIDTNISTTGGLGYELKF